MQDINTQQHQGSRLILGMQAAVDHLRNQANQAQDSGAYYNRAGISTRSQALNLAAHVLEQKVAELTGAKPPGMCGCGQGFVVPGRAGCASCEAEVQACL